MPSRARIQTVKADFLDSSLYEDAGVSGLPRLSRGTFVAALSRAFDLAEGRRPGHAQRVAYIGVSLARDLELAQGNIEEVLFGCLLHDVGMAGGQPLAQVNTGRGSRIVSGRTEAAQVLGSIPTGGWAEVIDALTRHCELGSLIARKLGLGESVARAIASHHDCWDGSGPSASLDDDVAPIVARVVAVADRVESMIDADGSPLLVRRQGPALVAEMAGSEIDPELAKTMVRLARRDDFWLGLYDNDMPATLSEPNYGGFMGRQELFDFAGVFSDVIDTRNGRTPGHSRDVAETARALALVCDLTERRADLVQLAAILQDIGTLGVPPQYLSKPDLLSIDEMDVVQLHPVFARDILSELPGLGAVAWWIGCHHERIDGKGYPGMLEGEEVPLEAQVIGIAETYDALLSDRPYRRAMSPADGFDVLMGLRGTRFSPWLLDRFESIVRPAAEETAG
jgi:HD-GYP domain-containing protein (c-di-GMP phosphodiesterase class II)